MKYLPLIDSIASNVTGTPVYVNKYNESNEMVLIQISGVIDATVSLLGSIDGSTFSPIQNAVFTSDTCCYVPRFNYLRADISAWTSGTVIVEAQITDR